MNAENLTDAQKAVVFIDAFEKLEYKKKVNLLSAFDNPKRIFTVEKDDKRLFERIKEVFPFVATALSRKAFVLEMINSSLKKADGVITLFDEGYPTELKNTPVPPLVLYYRGNARLLDEKTKVSMVGSRVTLPLYYKAAQNISDTLSAAGAVIVTGIADGGDDAAIKGALNNGRLISVLAGGLDCVYPQSKISLAEEIAEKGLLITEYPAGRPPRDFTYPVRNRIIAGLGIAAIIISGSAKSGARYTAGYAADYGREVLAFPYGLSVKSGELCISLLKQGATLIENAEDVAGALGITIDKKEEIKLEGTELAVYGQISAGVGDANKIIEKTGLKPYEISAALGMLELKGVIVRSGTEYQTVK